MSLFRCITLLPLRFAAAPLAATLRAGGTALVDCAGICEPDLLGRLIADLPPGRANGEIGLRLAPAQIALADGLAGRPHHVVLCNWHADELPALLERLRGPERAVWLELLGSDALAAVDPTLPFAGWLGRGAECGGRCGHESAFILCQHLATQPKPFWIQGGIGLHAAVACRAGGAAGVVLDDALLLLRDFPLPARWRATIATQNMEDTVVLGGQWGDARRIALRTAQALKARADEITEITPPTARAAVWREAADHLIGWGDPATHAWPLGQTAGNAAALAARHVSIGRLIRAIAEATHTHIATAKRLHPLAASGPLALAHKTAVPIVQGPMTRVSDGVPFAAAVARAGGLPMLALATMSGAQVSTLLDEAAAALAPHSWGVGLLGHLPPELAEAQLAALTRTRPPFAVIAGGRPDQAAQLDALGIATYIHVPTPALLRLFLEQGARRFVFEGAECGGHIGPLNSLALWDGMIETLLAALPAGEKADVLFAGGIHDARSAAMVTAMAVPLLERGVRIGVVLGSAYLFTHEAVSTGAIVESFQEEALQCRRTAVIETRPGHRIRCAPTPFVAGFEARRRALLHTGCAPTDVGETLEALLAGRLRLASKGVERSQEGLQPVPAARMRDEGMYMMGELAGLRAAPISCAELHQAVSEGATALIAAVAAGDEPSQDPAAPIGEPVAIIGIGCLLPGAHDPETLWRNQLDKVDAIGEIPRERWDWRLYFDADPTARDRIYSKWGGFIAPLPFDPMRFGIPPKSLASICLAQLLALEVTRRALEDAGLGDLSDAPALRERTAAIFGAASSGDLELMYKARSALPLITPTDAEAWQRLPEWTEESYPGILLNIVAGRVANRFDLGGCNFTVDAACASSLAALDLAVRELQSGRSDLALAGAVEAELSPHAYMAFSKTQALSAKGRARVFDLEADGIVLSEGAVTLVLKRLADAERDGDRVYAVIRGVAGSSDGKGMGLTAPKPAGQVKAVQRAHAAAGTRVASIGLYEAHGTGTKVGDQAEMETLNTALRQDGARPGSCVVGSVKALLGHTRAAAGLTGVVKSALALHHRVLPPQGGIQTPLPSLCEADSPARLIDQPQPWLQTGTPRRAGVSAFGFGGTNFHAVLEEHGDGGTDGADHWPCELVVLAAADRAGLARGLQRLQHAAEGLDKGLRLPDLALSSIVAAAEGGPLRLAMVVGSSDELRHALTAARQWLEAETPLPPGLFFSQEPAAGDLAFLFPGQGSQRPGMGSELALYTAELRNAFGQAEDPAQILPPAAFGDDQQLAQERALADTRVAQPAIAALSCGMLDFARRLELEPARVAGHSFGEFVALHAAGVIDRAGLMRLAATRGRVMADVGPETGSMSMVALGGDELEAYLAGVGDVCIANRNSPRQTVLSGRTAPLGELVTRLQAAGVTTRPLAVSAAFHSPLMRPARAPFADFLATGIRFAAPTLPVHANLDGKPYPEDADATRSRCIDHLEQPVNFVAQIEAMWAAGVRTFLELGPGRVLTGLVHQILGERPHLALASDGGLRGWLNALAQLWVQGHTPNLEKLFDGRRACCLDLDHLPAWAVPPAWLMDGGRIYRAGQPAVMGTQPFRDADSPATLPLGGHVDPLAAAYADYQKTMRQFLDQQEQMLSRMLNPRGEQAGSLPAAPSRAEAPAPPPKKDSPAPAQAASPDKNPLDREVLTRRLVQLVSDRTGYPPEMLRLEQDLEGELGIDSIKRIEIIGKLVKSLPAGTASALQKRFNRLVRAKSLQALIDTLLREAPVDFSAPAAPAPNDDDPCPRFVMTTTVKPLLRLGSGNLEGLHLVTADAHGLAERVAAGLRRHGARVSLISPSELAHPASRLAILREVHGPVRGIVHLTPLGRPSDEASLQEWRAATAAASKGLFALLQCCGDEIEDEAHALRLLAVSHMGGDWGRTGAFPGSPVGGGSHGILRSLEREFPHLLAKAADFDDHLPLDIMAERIVDEILTPGGGDEIGYRLGQRLIYAPEPAPWATGQTAHDWRPREGWVVLVTGGARGITAEICRELAAPGVRLILVGRAGKADQPEVAREREANLDAFRQAGATVEFHAVDVRSEPDFGGLIDDLYQRFGRIDAVVHGAGIIEDQRFLAKETGSFDRVFDTKADSTFILSQRLRPEGLKWMVLFGSISGRFGNHGQADYAAANETMARQAFQMNARWPQTRVVTINWGPWRSVGMAGEGIQALLEAQGIVPIEVQHGRRFFADELSWGQKNEAEVIAGQGPWAARPDQLLASVFEATVSLLQVSGPTGRHEK